MQSWHCSGTSCDDDDDEEEGRFLQASCRSVWLEPRRQSGSAAEWAEPAAAVFGFRGAGLSGFKATFLLIKASVKNVQITNSMASSSV